MYLSSVKKAINIKNIAVAGAGNVAWHLAVSLFHKGFHISGIWSRDENHAAMLANKCNSVVCKEISDLKQNADLIIIAVPDKAIGFVIENLNGFNGIVSHTAGSVSIDEMHHHFEKYCSIYPLQTFSKEKPVNFEQVPIFLEASADDVLLAIKNIALKLSNQVYVLDSSKRLLIHIAAVFAGNYTNLMYIISNNLLHSIGLPEKIIHPLILETARKAVNDDPTLVQTGPARRLDFPTLEKHLSVLENQPEYAHLYNLLAQTIINQYK